MSLSSQNLSTLKITIHFFPDEESFSIVFDNNKKFGDLKKELKEKYDLTKENYYFEMNSEIIDDEMILRDKGVVNDRIINAIDDNCVKIEVCVEDKDGKMETIQKYMFISKLKIIKPDENKIIKV